MPVTSHFRMHLINNDTENFYSSLRANNQLHYHHKFNDDEKVVDKPPSMLVFYCGLKD